MCAGPLRSCVCQGMGQGLKLVHVRVLGWAGQVDRGGRVSLYWSSLLGKRVWTKHHLASTLTEVFLMQARNLCTVPRTLSFMPTTRLTPGGVASCGLHRTAYTCKQPPLSISELGRPVRWQALRFIQAGILKHADEVDEAFMLRAISHMNVSDSQQFWSAHRSREDGAASKLATMTVPIAKRTQLLLGMPCWSTVLTSFARKKLPSSASCQPHSSPLHIAHRPMPLSTVLIGLPAVLLKPPAFRKAACAR